MAKIKIVKYYYYCYYYKLYDYRFRHTCHKGTTINEGGGGIFIGAGEFFLSYFRSPKKFIGASFRLKFIFRSRLFT